MYITHYGMVTDVKRLAALMRQRVFDGLDDALAWAAKATVACQGPVEVRPFQEDTEASPTRRPSIHVSIHISIRPTPRSPVCSARSTAGSWQDWSGSSATSTSGRCRTGS